MKGSFWHDVFLAWCTLNYKTIDYHNHSADILASNVWLNSNVLINKNPVFWKSWYGNSIKYIHDLINVRENRFYNWTEIQCKYKVKGNYLNLMSLLSAIPQLWHNTLFKYGPVIESTKPANNELSEIILRHPTRN